MRGKRINDIDTQRTESEAVWMVSFSDLLTVLLAMFVMRFSMTTFNPDTLKKVLPGEEVQAPQELSPSQKLIETLEPLLDSPSSSTMDQALDLDTSIVVEPKGEGALISLGGDTFQPGSRELSPEIILKIERVAEALLASDVSITIAGHTDNIPIHTSLYPSNWELSAARAIEVAELMQRIGIPGDRLSAVGYADTKPRADNETPEGRRQNRRVEILAREFPAPTAPDSAGVTASDPAPTQPQPAMPQQ